MATCGKFVPRDNRIIPLKADFDYLVDQELFGSDSFEQERKQLALARWQDLRDNEEQSWVKGLLGIEFAKITRVVRDEGVVFSNNSRHEIPIRLTTQSEIVDMASLMAAVTRHINERRVQAFID